MPFPARQLPGASTQYMLYAIMFLLKRPKMHRALTTRGTIPIFSGGSWQVFDHARLKCYTCAPPASLNIALRDATTDTLRASTAKATVPMRRAMVCCLLRPSPSRVAQFRAAYFSPLAWSGLARRCLQGPLFAWYDELSILMRSANI